MCRFFFLNNVQGDCPVHQNIKKNMKNILTTFALSLVFVLIGLGQNNSLDFDGTDDYIDLGDINALDGLSSLTIEVWLKLHNHGAFDRIIVKEIDGDPTNGWGMALSSTSGELSLYTRNGSNSNPQTTGNVIPLNTWTHIAYVFDGSGSGNTDRLKCYVNGSPVTLSYNGTVPSSLNSNNSSVTISRTSNAAGNYIDAQMDDIRIWTVARTQTEIQNNKDTELTGTETGLFSYYKMDNASSTCDIVDCNSNESHGTKNGTGGSNNLPQYSSDVPVLTNIGCGAAINCSSDNLNISGCTGGVSGANGNYTYQSNNANGCRCYESAGGAESIWANGSPINEWIWDGDGGCNTGFGIGTDIDCDITTNFVGSNGCIVGTVLPVEFINFKVIKNPDHLLFSWSTSSENQNKGFYVERSTNAQNWETIDFLPGKGTTYENQHYQYLDYSPLIGVSYYRLKQVDLDKMFEYSKVIAITYEYLAQKIQVFPNPSNGLINLQINNLLNQKMKIQITDSLGKNIWESELIENETHWKKEMTIKVNGIYFINIQIGNNIFNKRMIITN